MEVLDFGHHYWLDDNKSDTKTNELIFFKDNIINENGYNGTTNQEVLRVLIDRVKFLDKQLPHKNNKDIIYHLRMALILHEQRHLERLVDKGIAVELIKTLQDGHITGIKNEDN